MLKTQTLIHPETGALLKRALRIETVSYMGMSKEVSIEGWFPDDDGDGTRPVAASGGRGGGGHALVARYG